ncbi:hypothetical protein AX16_007534 [Volvariella volvacea WC 439]|nr:hypothetical protein AX16_007534 [Volvariella volvacea WC 439]
MQNITIENTNTTLIHYYPPLCDGTGWAESQTSDASGGSFTFCSGRNFARAVFRFTGVAVYFQAPRYETRDTMYVSLDNAAFEEIDLTSTNGLAQRSEVLWRADNLENRKHTLEMVPGAYNGSMGFVTVDSFIVTLSDQPPIDDNVATSVSSSSSSNRPVAIGVGVGLGVVVLMLIGVGVWMFLQKKKENAVPSSPAGQSTQPFLAPSPGIDSSANMSNMSQYAPYTDYRQSAVVMPDPAMALYSGAAPPSQVQSTTLVVPQPNYVQPGAPGTANPNSTTAYV